MTKQMDLGIYLHTKVAVVSVILKKGFSKSERDHVAPSSGTWKRLQHQPISELPFASVSKRVLVHNHTNGNYWCIFTQVKLIII